MPDVVGPDPVDVRLLTVVAETGRAAVHEIAGRLGMDVREVAARLAALSTTGLPLVVGVECDPQSIHNALAAAQAWNSQSGPYQAPNPANSPYPGQNTPTGGHPMQHPYGAQNPDYSSPNGPQYIGPTAPHVPGASGPPPAAGPPPQARRQDPMNTWGPPGSAAWARGDQHGPDGLPPHRQAPHTPSRTGKIGNKLDVDLPESGRITMALVEVVDPADFLFTAAGYQLRDRERTVVAHTELTNHGSAPFTMLPDLGLVLVATDGSTVPQAQASLSSRPPHRAGVPPGETAGGHTVYVLPESTELSSIRWTPGTGDERHTLTWDISDI